MTTEDVIEEEFWRFSLAFYERPGVAEALIALQDRGSFDVNVTLFALWFGISGRGVLGHDLLAAAEREATALRSEVVEPLRELRRRLRGHPDAAVQRLREGVKELELAGERLVQEHLDRLARQGCRSDEPAERRAAAAHANLALYLGTEWFRSGETIIILSAVDEFLRNL